MSLSLFGGQRNGTGALTAGSLYFSSGALSGSGQTNIVRFSGFYGTSSQTIGSGHTLTLSGISLWSQGNGSILNSGNILSYGNFTDQGTATSGVERRLTNGASGYFANVGTYVRQGEGTTVVDTFHNLGALYVNQGTLRSVGNSGFNGTVSLASGTALEFAGGDAWMGASVSGAGTVRVSGGSVAFNAGSSFASALELNGGIMDVQVNQTVAALTMNGGTRSGAANLTASSLAFNAGALNGGGTTTTITGASTFNGLNDQFIGSGHTLVLNGNSNWTEGNGSVLNSGTIMNLANRTFTDSGTFNSAVTRQLSNGSAGIFNNQGRYTRSGQGTTQVSVFNNSGVLNVNSGTFKVTGNSTFTGTTVVFDGGALVFDSGSSLAFSGGASLSGGGTTTILGASTFDGASSKTIGSGHKLVISGNSTWSMGAGSILNSGTITNTASSTFMDLGSTAGNSRELGNGSAGVFNNQGTYVRQGVGGTRIAGLNNQGTLDIQSGEILVDDRFVNTGTVTIASGAKLQSDSSPLTVGGELFGNGLVLAPLTLSVGLINPGAPGAIGTLSFQGTLNLTDDSRLHIDLGAGGLSDLLVVSGGLALGGTLELAWGAGSGPQLGDVFTVATFGSLSPSSFKSLSWTDSNYGFELLYGASDLRVRVTNVPTTAVPEPETYALAMGGLMVTWLARRRMRRA